MKITEHAKKAIFAGAALLFFSILPSSALAAGITAPTGADAVTYTYNDKTGLWENQYYTWSPETKKYTPKFSQAYTYNPTTGKYDTTNYVYDPAAGKYDAVNKSVDTPPLGVTVIGGPPPPAPSTAPGSGTDSTNSLNNDNTPASTDNTTTDTAPGTGNNIDNSDNSSLNNDSSATATVDNQLVSSATSGDTAVTDNTTAGSATSGNAAETATVVNLLQSDSSLQANTATFTYNVSGNVQGDITIDPAQLSGINTSVPASSPSDVSINASESATINNNIQLTAISGNAAVDRNTQAGNATSGNADAVADILNAINSIISSGRSFIGTINIYGNLNGDILLPRDTLNKILASNYPTVDATLNPDGSISVDNIASINNQVSLAAVSGSAQVHNNTSAGSATSGTATTNLVLLNLTGQQIICGNALLVFVNVLGNWVGMIVNAPAGTTAAALGGSSCHTFSLPSSASISSASNSNINNNLTVSATSGNADVTENTQAGSALSGSATASANIVNIANSVLSFSDWFGLLFINVFGTWNGSFGINTSAGDAPLPNNSSGTGSSSGQHTAAPAAKVFKFIPSVSGSGTFRSSSPISIDPAPIVLANAHTGSLQAAGQVLAAGSVGANHSHAKSASGTGSSLYSWLWVGGGLVAIALINLPGVWGRRKNLRK